MIRKRFPAGLLGLAVALAIGLGGSGTVLAQDAGDDDILDKLLQKIEEPKTPEKAESGDQAPAKEDEIDKELDSILKRLGATEEEAAPEGESSGLPLPKPETEPPAPKDDAKPLDQGEKHLDQHLKELTGRISKDRRRQEQQEEATGPLAEAIKKMEEARERLAQNDTGDKTRETQGQIVKQLDQILNDLRRSSRSQQGGSQSRLANRLQGQGQPQPGQSGTTGANAQGTGPQKPLPPDDFKTALRDAKDTWGGLPPHLRDEVMNVFREQALPSKSDLVSRYYLSITKKSGR